MSTNKHDLFGLTKRDSDTINNIFAKYPEVLQVKIFGSRALGTYHAGSDIDLAITNANLKPNTLLSIKSDFAESTLPYNADIFYLPLLNNKDFIEHIERVGIVIYEK